MNLKRGIGYSPILAAVLVVPAFCSTDAILLHGHVYTANPRQKWAQAIAVSGGRITQVGTDEAISRLRDASTKVIDLRGRTVIPGIVDSHTHMWFGALALHGFNLATPEVWVEPSDENSFVAKIRDYAAAHPKDKVIFGRAVFPLDVRHELLDKAVSDRPVVIHDATEHRYWVNQKGIEMAHVTEQPVPNPEFEKFILRDAKRRPTGVFPEASMQVIEHALPPQPLEEKLAWLSEASHYLNRYGITSVVNATGDLDEIALYGALRDRGQLTVRTRTAFGNVALKHKLTPQFLDQLQKARTTYHDEWVSANLVKFFADGSGGPLLYEPAEFEQLVTELDRRGYQIMTHAIGFVPAHMVVDAYEKIVEKNGARDRRLRIEHAKMIPRADIPRVRKLGATVSMQPTFCCVDDGNGDPTSVYRTFENNGTNVAFGSDWPCTWPPDPFAATQQSMRRELRKNFTHHPGGPHPAYVSPEERITVEQAIDAYTRNGAWARFSEKEFGTLEPGKFADLVVLSQDIFTAAPEKVNATHAMITMVGGKIVYQAEK